MSEASTLIWENLDKNGRLPCATAYKISAKTKTSIGEVGKLASRLDIRISACGLGQFGGLEKGEYSKKPLID